MRIMKNVMIFINPDKDFGPEEHIDIKIQIDNSLDLCWKKEDIMLITNFPYEYNGIKAMILSGNNFTPYFGTATKIKTIISLFKKNLIKKRVLYWFHDLDVFQNYEVSDKEMRDEIGRADIGLCDKGRMPRWSTGSIFFKFKSLDIFQAILKVANKYQINEEPAFNAITSNNLLWVTTDNPEEVVVNNFIPANIPGTKNINKRIKKINIKYNFMGANIRSCYKMAGGQFKMVHFHPFGDEMTYGGQKARDFFIHGKNKLQIKLIPDRLAAIFKRHGIQ